MRLKGLPVAFLAAPLQARTLSIFAAIINNVTSLFSLALVGTVAITVEIINTVAFLISFVFVGNGAINVVVLTVLLMWGWEYPSRACKRPP